MNRAALNLVLLVVVLGLAAAAWFANQKKNAPKEKLTALSAAAVSTAEIAWPGAPLIKLVKTGSNWQLTAPVAAQVDPFEVLAVTNLASTEVQEVLTPEGLNLKDIGLAPADHSITLNATKIDFGSIEPLNARRYVRVGSKVMLVDDPPSAALDRDYNDLVAKELFAPGEEIVSVSLPGGMHFSKAADGEWTSEPANAEASPAAIKTLVEGWKNAKSLYNETAATPVSGDAVVLTLKDGSTRQFIVAATDPQLSLYSPALQLRYVLSKALVDMLLKLPVATSKSAAEAPK